MYIIICVLQDYKPRGKVQIVPRPWNQNWSQECPIFVHLWWPHHPLPRPHHPGECTGPLFSSWWLESICYLIIMTTNIHLLTDPYFLFTWNSTEITSQYLGLRLCPSRYRLRQDPGHHQVRHRQPLHGHWRQEHRTSWNHHVQRETPWILRHRAREGRQRSHLRYQDQLRVHHR